MTYGERESEEIILKYLIAKQSDLFVVHEVFATTAFIGNNQSNFKLPEVLKFRQLCRLVIVPMSAVGTISVNTSVVVSTGSRGVRLFRKDVDYFVFHTQASSSSKLISLFSTTPEITTGIKNKVGVILSSEGHVEHLYSTCFYCDAGAPKLIQLSNTDRIFSDYLQNFHKKVFTVSTPVLTKAVLEIRRVDGDWRNIRGMMNSALNHVLYKYNCSGRPIPTNGAGGKTPNGTWVGAVGDLLARRADIGQIAGRVFSRNEVVAFSFPITYIWMTFTTGQPKTHYSWKSVYYPLSATVWILVCGSILVAIITLKIFVKELPEKNPITTQNLVSYLARSFLEQDTSPILDAQVGKFKKRKDGIRVFMAFWLFFCLLIVNSYRSKLVSFLLFPMVEEPPKTFQDLATSTRFKVALHYLKGAAYSILKSSKHPTFQTIFKKMQLEESEVKCFQRVIQENRFVCISWNLVADYVKHKNASDKYGNSPVIRSQETSSFIQVGFTYRKGVIYKEKFDRVVMWAVAMGLVPKWQELDNVFVRRERRDWEMSVGKAEVVYKLLGEGEAQMLKSENLTGTYLLLLVGLNIAVMVFVAEIMKRKCTGIIH